MNSINVTDKLRLLIAILSIVLNTLKLLLLYSKKGGLVLNVTSIFFIHCGITNWLVGVSTLICIAVKEGSTNSHVELFYYRSLLTRITLTIVSLNLIIFVAIRYLAVTNVDFYRRINRKIYIRICIAAWCLTCFIVLVSHYLFDVDVRNYEEFFTYYASFIIIPGTIIIVVLYGRIMSTIRRQQNQYFLHTFYCNSEKCRNLSSAKQIQTKPFQRIEEEIELQSNIQTNKQHFIIDLAYQKRFNNLFEIKLIKLLGIFIVLFVICLLPLPIYCINTQNAGHAFKRDGAFNLLVNLAFSYCLLQPLCYTIHTKTAKRRQTKTISNDLYGA